jgi:hypothetical protein
MGATGEGSTGGAGAPPLEPGTPVRLEPAGSEDAGPSYRTAVREVGEAELTLYAPEVDGAAYAVPGAGLRLVVLRGQNAWVGTAQVLEAPAGEPRLMRVTRPADFRWTLRRRSARTEVRFPVRGRGWRGFVVNLSAHGCWVRVEEGEVPHLGDSVRFTLPLDAPGRPLGLHGVVTRYDSRVGPSHFALEFQAIGDEERDRLARFVRRRALERGSRQV